jgi:hypothetical protein
MRMAERGDFPKNLVIASCITEVMANSDLFRYQTVLCTFGQSVPGEADCLSRTPEASKVPAGRCW